jgi:hypothetical protein
MAKIAYIDKRFNDEHLAIITAANKILTSLKAQGYDITLRQLYYQFVSKDLIANNQREYKRLGGIINDARLAGLVDWDHIVDRTREVRGVSHWTDPAQIVATCAKQFRIDKWTSQPWRVEVWIEKDALVGVVERVCRELDVSYFSCRGYVSQSEIHEAAKDRLIPFERAGQQTLLLHLGDHDPSGIDMSRDIRDRLELFGSGVVVQRIALNRNQVDQYEPPPNPAKLTDSRATDYIAKHGDESWELDALEPQVINDLIRKNVMDVRDEDAWTEAVEKERKMRNQLQAVSDTWEDIIDTLPPDDGT